MKFIPILIILHCLFAVYMFGSEDIFPTSIFSNNGEVVVAENGVYNRLISIPGLLNSFIVGITLCFSIIFFCFPSLVMFCKKSKSTVEEETQSSQGSYKEELGVIKKHGLHTYKILDNPDYRDLVLSLNSTADNLQNLKTFNSADKPRILINNYTEF